MPELARLESIRSIVATEFAHELLHTDAKPDGEDSLGVLVSPSRSPLCFGLPTLRRSLGALPGGGATSWSSVAVAPWAAAAAVAAAAAKRAVASSRRTRRKPDVHIRFQKKAWADDEVCEEVAQRT